ncbi:MAG: MFS transporter [Acidimicrobiia bacterium]
MRLRSPSPALILAVVAFGVFIAADDLTVVSTMLRQIILDLNIPLPEGFDDAAWIVNGYLIAYVVVMPFMGRVSDLYGRRRVFVAALALFLVGSIWVPLTNSLPAFLVGRVLTALGGGAMVPVGMAVIGDVFQERRRPSALGTLGAVDTAGWVWGPLLGALLVRFLSWRWQFYLNIPLAIVGIALAWWALRDLDRPLRRARIDWAGVAALTAGLVALNVALLNTSDIQTVGSLVELTSDESPSTIPFFLAAALALPLFVWIERRRPHPLIDLSLFGRSNFTPAVFVNFLVGAVLIIAMVNVPLFVNITENDLGRAALNSGLVLSALTVSMAVMSYVGGRLTERLWYRPVTMAGLAACAVGFLLMGSTWTADTSLGRMAWQLVILGAGFGLVMAPTGAAVIDAAPSDQRGTAAGLAILMRLMGLSVGLSGLTAWGLYRFNVLRSRLVLPPVGDPGYQEALADATSTTTASALAETFLFSVAVAALALVVALWLRRVYDRPAPAG